MPIAENEAVSIKISLNTMGISVNLTRRYPAVIMKKQINNSPVRNLLNITNKYYRLIKSFIAV